MTTINAGETKEQRRLRREQDLNTRLQMLDRLDMEREGKIVEQRKVTFLENQMIHLVDIADDVKTGRYTDAEIGSVIRALLKHYPY